MRQDKLTQGGIVGEAIDTLTHRVNQDGGRAVENIARSHLLAATLHKILNGGLGADRGYAPVYRKDSTNGHVHVNVGRSIERIHGHHVFARIVAGMNNVLLLLRSDGTRFAAVFQGPAEPDIGNHIQLLLAFPLYVFDPHLTGQVDESGPIHLPVDNFTGQGNVPQQLG